MAPLWRRVPALSIAELKDEGGRGFFSTVDKM